MADYDVVIAGAGLIGASLGCALAQDGNARVAVIDPTMPDMQNHPSFDDRGITLSLSSRRIFTALGLWDEGLSSRASPIRRIRVTDRGQPGCVRFDAGELGLEAFGYVVSARDLGQTLMSKLHGSGRVEIIAPATVSSVQSSRGRIEVDCAQGETHRKLSARLLVAADGANSTVRAMLGIPVEEKDYAQTAIVANVAVAKPEPETAHERFTEEGPLALLPLGGERHVMVLTVTREAAGRFMALPEDELLRCLEARTGGRL
ncbi:MAG TPA: FAD-dependent monooxygenase, partial [Gammaproteobacteria bacterium]|nr:FAD-dependent monooxygenase [Gammaproteobacteria bacterium]